MDTENQGKQQNSYALTLQKTEHAHAVLTE